MEQQPHSAQTGAAGSETGGTSPAPHWSTTQLPSYQRREHHNQQLQHSQEQQEPPLLPARLFPLDPNERKDQPRKGETTPTDMK